MSRYRFIRRPQRLCTTGAAIALAAVVPQSASAYVGPGAGLTALGTVVALVLALVLALIGFVWYPMKRLARRRRAKSDADRAERERK